MNIYSERARIENASLIINFLKKLYLELGEEKESLEFLNKELIENMLSSETTQIILAKTDKDAAGLLTLTESRRFMLEENTE